MVLLFLLFLLVDNTFTKKFTLGVGGWLLYHNLI